MSVNCVRGISSLVLIAFLAVVPSPARADAECRAVTDRTSVPMGGEIKLQVTVEGDVGWSAEFKLPDLGPVKVYDGGTNQSMSSVNGRTRTSVSRTWYLRVNEQRNFTIGPVKVTAAGQTCETRSIDIEVTAAVPVTPDTAGNRTAPPPGQAAPGRPAPATSHTGDEIFVTLEADKEEAWIGEQIILSFRYWRRIQPWNNPSYTAPRTEGFWREELGPERTYRQVLNGRAYNVTEIRYALFPTRAGNLDIEPASLAFPEDVFDRFFSNRRRSRGPRTLRTGPVTVRVSALPQPAPEGFSGLVANELRLTAAVDRDTVPRGEPVGWAVSLDADGFLKGFDGLAVTSPEGARLHDATEDFAVDPRGDRLRSAITLEKVIVPEVDEDLVVPPVDLVWFDANADRYRTTSGESHLVTVTAGTGGGAGEHETSGFMRSEIARLGEDLAFIHPVPRNLDPGGEPFTGSAPWWILLLAPAAVLGIWRLILLRWSVERRDPARRRRRKALGAARKSLAEVARDPGPAAADRIVRAVLGYVADRLDEPVAAVGAAELRQYCAERGRADLGEDLADLIDVCDAARFGGGAELDPPTLASRADAGLVSLAGAPDRKGGAAGATVALLLAGVMSVAVVTGVTAQSPDPARLLAEGNQAYTEGDLDRALSRYLAAREAGADDPVLHFNLGNTHARRGELGLAMASYERARRRAPRDRDIDQNAAWVSRHLRDLELAHKELPLFIRQFVQAVHWFTLDEWGAVLLLVAWALATVIGWAWWREGFGDGLRRAALLLAAVTIAAGVITAWRWHGERVVVTGVVVTGEVTVRSGPAESFPALFQVHDGLTLRVEARREGWTRVSLGGDWQGWLPGESVTLVD
ncbi:MAG: hypothetical protein GY838_17695 [bacterium]|nr:hypothetical protein [bacterium]